MAGFTSPGFKSLIGLALLSFALFHAINAVHLHLSRRRIKKEHGCKPAPRAGYRRYLYGFDVVWETLEWSKKHQFLALQTKRYSEWGNTYANRRVGQRSISTIEPENVKAVLATRFKDFGLAIFREDTMGPFLGKGIFTTDGEYWASSRHMIRPNFTRDQVADLAAFERHVKDLFALIPRDGKPVELQDLFLRFTMDSATEFLFGKSVGSLRRAGTDEDEGNRLFSAAFTAAQDDCVLRFRYGPLKRWVKPSKLEGKTADSIVWRVVDQFVDEAVQHHDSSDVEKNPKEEEKYVFAHELAKQTTDKRRLRDELLNVLLAGRDTTASLLGNMFNVVAKRPDIWQKLRAEVAQLGGSPPTYAQLKDLKYVRWCLNESLRLQPVVPDNSRTALRDTVLPVGGGADGKSPVFVPKGTLVAWTVYAMHRRKDLYGADAEEFRPERWETLRPGWEYLPFNGGPRICIGQQYALAEAAYVTTRILQEFAGIESRDEHEWQEHIMLACCSNRGALVSLTPA